MRRVLPEPPKSAPYSSHHVGVNVLEKGGTMRSSLIVVVSVAAIAAASLAWTQPWAAHASPMARHAAKSGFLLLPPAAPAGQMVMYGHVKKLMLKRVHY